MPWLLAILVLASLFAYAGLKGAPYVPILRRDSTALLKLAALKPGQTLIDLGSGDGRLLRAAAAQGIYCIGYEINPVMVWISRLVCWRYRDRITIHLADLWHTKLPRADAIYVFLMPRHMGQLRSHLQTQIHRPTKVISYAFEIPGLSPVRKTRNTFLYELSDSRVNLK